MPSDPSLGTVALKQMKVTQFVSVLVYTSVFVTIWNHTNFAATGFGRLTPCYIKQWIAKDDPTAVPALKFVILGVIVALNAIRYHLSFWSVEEHKGFEVLCDWAGKDKKLRWHTRGDVLLRVASYIVLFLLQLSCSKQDSFPEGLLVALFAFMVGWDILILRIAYLRELTPSCTSGEVAEAPNGNTRLTRITGRIRHRLVSMRRRVANVRTYMKGAWQKEGCPKADEVAVFKREICHWLVAEGVALCCMVIYLVWVVFSNMPKFTTLLVFASVGMVSLVVALWDLWTHRRKYLPIVKDLLFYVALLLGAMKLMGLDH